MAKAKNISSVVDIIISDDAQLYEIPGNWTWVKLGGIADVKGGKRVPKGKKLSDDKTEHPYIRVTDMSNGTIDLADIKYVDDDIFSMIHNYTISSRDVYISVAGSIGKIGIIPESLDGANLTENAAKITNIIGTDNKYLMMYLQSNVAQLQMVESTISTTQPKLALFRIENINVPLPPLAEQKRIVDQIESLFSKLDDAKEKLQSIIDAHEDRRAAILHRAFEGRITQQWRKRNSVTLESWNNTTIGGIAELVTKGASPRWQGVEYLDDNTQTLFVTSENVREGYLDLTKEKYLDNKINEIQKRSVLKKGDVLVNIVGASIGRSAIYNIDKKANTNQAVCLIRLSDIELNQYVCFYLNSPVALRYYSENKSETARANLSLADIKNLHINVPSKAEAEEIMKVVKMLMDNENRVVDNAVTTLDNIETIKKSILAKAFRGELGTNDPSEESSIEMLRRIIGEQA